MVLRVHMALHVDLEVGAVVADRAGERLLPRVRDHVAPHVERSRERSAATRVRTGEGLVSSVTSVIKFVVTSVMNFASVEEWQVRWGFLQQCNQITFRESMRPILFFF